MAVEIVTRKLVVHAEFEVVVDGFAVEEKVWQYRLLSAEEGEFAQAAGDYAKARAELLAGARSARLAAALGPNGSGAADTLATTTTIPEPSSAVEGVR